jgi:hypothetical protein
MASAKPKLTSKPKLTIKRGMKNEVKKASSFLILHSSFYISFSVSFGSAEALLLSPSPIYSSVSPSI